MSKVIILFCSKCKTELKTHLENSDARCPRCGKKYSSVKIAEIK